MSDAHAVDAFDRPSSMVDAGKRPMARRPRYILAAVLALVGLALLLGGAWLIALSGSPYYVLAGLLVSGASYLSLKGDERALWAYALMLLASAAWALWEVGLDFWGLQARLLAPAILGVWAFWPLARRAPLPSVSVIAAAVLVLVAGSISATRTIGTGAIPPSTLSRSADRDDWTAYGGTLAGTRFASETQINPGNVGGLVPAWTYRTGVMKTGIGFEATPLMVGDTVYLCTSNNIIIALDPDTGTEKWRFDSHSKLPPAGTCRGVAYYKSPTLLADCNERIVFATVDARLMAVDAQRGTPCRSFGRDGVVDLSQGMGRVDLGYYYASSAPTIVNGGIVLGGWVADGQYVGEPSGVIRSFDAIDGSLRWAWDMDHPENHGLPAAGKTYSRGTPNSWAPMSGDERLGLVFLPTGNSTPDYWGAHRSPASEKYTSSVVALDSRTGEVRWSFQTVHHDLWDYDVASQPTLVDLPVAGKMVPALVQPTKRGQVFVLDRRTGRPIMSVVEKMTPQGPAPGDFLSPTQPFSSGMPAFDSTVLSEQTMWGATPLDQLWCRIKFKQARYDGPLTPPGVRPTITYPSFLGGINWGSVSVDPERGVMIANWNRIANYTHLVPRAAANAEGVKVSKDGGVHVGMPVAQMGTPFALATQAFLSPLQMPCTEPPFGKIAAVDLRSRKVLWERPLGSAADSGPSGFASHLPLQMGVPNAGGSIITRSGLVFIGATQQRAIRAFDLRDGRRLWEAPLPAGGHATPLTYVSPRTGRQYVVISAGGNATLLSGAGDYVMAFALPK